MSHSASTLVLLAVLAGSASGCTEEIAHPVTVKFSLEVHFRYAEKGRLLVLDAQQGECVDLRTNISGTQENIEGLLVDSGTRPICEFFDGFALSELPEQAANYVFIATDQSGSGTLLFGCRRYDSLPERIEIQPQPTAFYNDFTAGKPGPECPSVDAKCRGTCG